MNYTCPVCYYANLPYPPEDYNICLCCGTEFGVDDSLMSWEELRFQWIARGAGWFYGNPPLNWSSWAQLGWVLLDDEHHPAVVSLSSGSNFVNMSNVLLGDDMLMSCMG